MLRQRKRWATGNKITDELYKKCLKVVLKLHINTMTSQ